MPSGCAAVPALVAAEGMARVEPRRLRAERSVVSSSNQLLCLVASCLPLSRARLRSASKTVAARSEEVPAAAVLEEATTAPPPGLRFLRLMRWPASSSEEEKSESSVSLPGGGVAGRFRRFALPFAPRFLKMATGAMGAAGAAPECVSVSAIVLRGGKFGAVAILWKRCLEMGGYAKESRVRYVIIGPSSRVVLEHSAADETG